jgi:hypothetical protein
MSVRMVSPEAARCAAMPSILSIFKLSSASSRVSPSIQAPALQLGRGDAADAHLHAFTVAEAALQHDDAAFG